MDNIIENTGEKLPLNDRISLIANYPLFSALDSKDLKELALLAKEVTYPSQSAIVSEGEIVDSVYLIARGTAEVTQSIQTEEKTPVAILTEGDAIGLNEASFFSHSGLRTATVTATSPITLLAIDIKKFDTFLKTPGVIYPALKYASEKILLMNFLKETHLFHHLANEKIEFLANHVKRITIKAGETIFTEGDIADKCYFLLTGEMMVNTNDHVLKKVAPLTLFGEGPFLENGLRNSSAYAETDCDLFLITHDDFQKLLKADDSFLKSLNFSHIEKIKPTPLAHLEIQHKMNIEGETIVTFMAPSNENEVRISLQEYAIWLEINGMNTLGDIHNKLKTIPLSDIYLFVIKLYKENFIRLS